MLVRTLVLATSLSLSGPPPSTGDAPSPRQLYERGRIRYETADYGGAIELWTEAYAAVEPVPENASIRASLLFNLGTAHQKAYEIDHDLTHLRRAKVLFSTYRKLVEATYTDEEARLEEQARIDGLIAEIDAILEARNAGPATKDESEEAQEDADEEDATTPPPELEPENPPDPARDDARGDAKARAMMISGAVLAGLGIAAAGVGIAGAVMGSKANDISGIDPNDLEGRAAQFDYGRTGNIVGIAGTVSAAVLVPTGAALLVLGRLRQKKALAVSPSAGPTWAGVFVQGRF